MSIALAKEPLKIMQGCVSMENNLKMNASDSVLQECAKKYFPGNASLIIWRVHAIVWGIIRDGCVQLADEGNLDADTVLEIRMFNEKAELQLVRNGDCFIGRYINDEGNLPVKYVDSLARLWGRAEARKGEYVLLKDAQRKLELTVPCKDDAGYYGLVTRNYIGYAPQNGQAGYVDYRYVTITSAEGGK